MATAAEIRHLQEVAGANSRIEKLIPNDWPVRVLTIYAIHFRLQLILFLNLKKKIGINALLRCFHFQRVFYNRNNLHKHAALFFFFV